MESGKHPPAWSRRIRRLFRPFLTQREKETILEAVAREEARTTSPIVVHLIARAGRRNMLELAEEIFHRLELHKAPDRNGVLLLISHLDHQFAFWSDATLHAKTGEAFWKELSDRLAGHFAGRRYAEGILDSLSELGNELSRRFPRHPTSNEASSSP